MSGQSAAKSYRRRRQRVEKATESCMLVDIISNTYCELAMTLKKLWTTKVELTLFVHSQKYIS